MTQINFYALSNQAGEARLQFACRLIEKAYSLGHAIYVQTESAQQAKALDELLWQFSPSSFVPHALLQTDSSASEAVLISEQPPAAKHQDVLLNLNSVPSEAHQQFSRINEIIAGDEQSLQQGRISYRFYKEKGYKAETFKI